MKSAAGNLGDLVSKVGSGVTPKGGHEVYVNDGVTFIRSQNVLWGKLDLSDCAKIPHRIHEAMGSSKVKSGDVLLNITGASIGRSCVVPEWVGEANVNQHVCILRPARGLVPQYLSNFLNSEYGQRQINALQTAGNRQGLNYEQIRKIRIPTTDASKQKKLSEMFDVWDRAIELQRRLLTRQEIELQVNIDTFCLPGFLKRKKFNKVLLQDIGKFKNGINKDKNSFGQGTKFVNLMDVFGFREISEVDKLGLVTVSANEARDFSLLAGDIIFVRSSVKPSGVGLTTLVKFKETGIVYSGFLIRYRFDQSKLDPNFAKFVFHTSIFRKSLLRKSTIGANTNINQSSLESLEIQIPEMATQKAIARVLDQLENQIKLGAKKLALLELQKQGIMQKIFGGHK